jgi:hypothetical protein
MIHRAIGIILFLTGLVVLLLPRYILPVCEYHGYSPMACSHTGTAEMFLGLIVMAAATGIILSMNIEVLRWSSFTVVATGVSMLLIPTAIGFCHSTDMPCNYGTIPAVRLAGTCILIVSFTGFFLSLRREKKRESRGDKQ